MPSKLKVFNCMECLHLGVNKGVDSIICSYGFFLSRNISTNYYAMNTKNNDQLIKSVVYRNRRRIKTKM